jgi:hypothetical protein
LIAVKLKLQLNSNMTFYMDGEEQTTPTEPVETSAE